MAEIASDPTASFEPEGASAVVQEGNYMIMNIYTLKVAEVQDVSGKIPSPVHNHSASIFYGNNNRQVWSIAYHDKGKKQYTISPILNLDMKLKLKGDASGSPVECAYKSGENSRIWTFHSISNANVPLMYRIVNTEYVGLNLATEISEDKPGVQYVGVTSTAVGREVQTFWLLPCQD